MKKFCIITNREKDIDLSVSNQIAQYLVKQNCEVSIAKEARMNSGYTDAAQVLPDTECAIVLGGDGTLIRAARDLLKLSIPILGVNLGTLGFLAEVELTNLYESLKSLIDDNYTIEERLMLTGAYEFHDSSEVCEGKMTALNDIAITRSGFSRIIQAGIYVNGSFVQDFRGDGVIVSTPTGSTGYNLSAGGPIILPTAEVIVITPICPHSFKARSLVIPATEQVEIVIRESKKTQEKEAIVTVDGDMQESLGAGDRIVIKKANQKTKLIRLTDSCFFNLLRTKFGE